MLKDGDAQMETYKLKKEIMEKVESTIQKKSDFIHEKMHEEIKYQTSQTEKRIDLFKSDIKS
jgi:hypothetical protein